MNYIRNYHDIPIHILGYDRDAELEKRKKEALKNMDKFTSESSNDSRNFSDTDRKKYTKMLEDLNIPVNVLNPKKK